ncbi:MAG: autoinducer 2 ABC transporter substrate-binding protein [Pseudomonadota bacterium]
MKKTTASLLALGLGATALTGVAIAQETYKIPTVVKISGIQWFNRMEEGVKAFAEETGHDAFQVGPASADAQLQVQVIEDMIAQGADAITVVPFSPEAVEPVLKRAMDAGIKVVTHEASNIENAHWDLEAFRNFDFGGVIMQGLAECMEEEGEYAVFVGSLTSKTHNEWVDGAIAYQEENYPNMTLVGDKNETYDDQQQAYQKAQEILRTFPNIKGMQGSASTDVAGIGLAIEERGLEDDVCVFGLSIPSIAGQYMETGAVDAIYFWDAAQAAEAMNKLAVMLLEGKEIGNGLDLGIPGYNSLIQEGKVLYGEAAVKVTMDNIAEYPL